MPVAVYFDNVWDDATPVGDGVAATVLTHINIGGPQVVDGSGNTWVADDPAAWTGGTVFDAGSIPEVANTTDDIVFQTQRYSSTAGSMTRHLDLADGNYVIGLRWAELTSGYYSEGARVQYANAGGAGTPQWNGIDVWDFVEEAHDLTLERNIAVSGGAGIDLVIGSDSREGYLHGLVIRTGTDAVADPTPVEHAPPEEEPTLTDVGGDIANPGSLTAKLTTPGVLAILTGNADHTNRWGLQPNISNRVSANFAIVSSDPHITSSNGSRILRWRNPGNLTYPDARWGGGMGARIDLMDVNPHEPQGVLYVGYDVWMPGSSEYHWASGKMPGIFGIKDGTTHVSSGGNFSDDSCALRLLFQPDKGLSDYLYVYSIGSDTIHTKSNPERGWSNRFVKSNGTQSNVFTEGQWHRVVLGAHVNSAFGVNDGIFRVWVDGYLGRSRTNVGYRSPGYNNMAFNGFFFEWFYGGGPEHMPNYTTSGVKTTDNPTKIGFRDVVFGTSYAAVS